MSRPCIGRAATAYSRAFKARLGNSQDRFNYGNVLLQLNRDRQAAAQYALVKAPASLAGDAAYQRARALLKADLAQAAPRRVRERDGTPARNAFVGSTAGDSRAMSGAAPLLALVRRGWTNPDAEPRASMQYVEYRLVDGQLERSVRTALDGAAPGVPQVMLAGIESATIGYHYRGQWIDGWPCGDTAMHDAVRLKLQLQGLGRIEQLFLLPGTES